MIVELYIQYFRLGFNSSISHKNLLICSQSWLEINCSNLYVQNHLPRHKSLQQPVENPKQPTKKPPFMENPIKI